MSYDVSLLITDGKGDEHTVWEGNYTSNLAGVWDEAGILLRDWTDARALDVIDTLRVGIATISEDLAHYTLRDPENGWGTAADMLENFLRPMLDAMERWPNARVSVWR